mgnify:CR=1 FL=1
MGQINVNVEGLRSTATKFISAATRCTQMKSQLETSTNETMSLWTGNGKSAFEIEFQIMCKNMITYSDALKDISAEFTAIAQGFEDRDKLLNNDILRNIK